LPVIFVDAVYYIAMLNRDDDLRGLAVEVTRELTTKHSSFLTTDAVLVEVLAYVCERGVTARRAAVALVDALRERRDTEVIPQTRELFDAGLGLFRRRPDKGYSLTDCMSMVLCRERDVLEVLTHDNHFVQEGFDILL
jgi:predicted nucleic acid-binding protein